MAIQKEKDRKKSEKKKGGNNNNSADDDDDYGDQLDANGNKRKEYPYEPLPRSGLAHPFVQAILSPWLGPDADQDAIQLGLTTLRTWWQHRRKGESGSAMVALGTEKMVGVVEGYTRHFFNLAHCLIVNDKEQPPRSLLVKIRDVEKSRNPKPRIGGGETKKRGRDDDDFGGIGDEDRIKLAAAAFQNGFGGGAGGMGVGGMNNSTNSLEQLLALQRRQLAEQGGVHMENQHNSNPTLELKGRCMPGRVDLPGLVQQVSSAATQLAHRGIAPVDPSSLPSRSGVTQQSSLDPSKHGDPNIIPLTLVSQNGDVQFIMTIDGITCAHCVKIVETVLKGCPGNRSPIDGLIDAVADRDMNFVLIKVEKTADARRIAFEAARNLSMVGYTAKARSLDIQRVGKSGRGAAAAVGSEGGGSDDMTLQSMCAAFDAVPNVNPMLGDFFHWNSECCCPDNTISRNGCPRCVIEGYCICAFLLITTVADSSSRLSFTLQTLSNGTWHLEDV